MFRISLPENLIESPDIRLESLFNKVAGYRPVETSFSHFKYYNLQADFQFFIQMLYKIVTTTSLGLPPAFKSAIHHDLGQTPDMTFSLRIVRLTLKYNNTDCKMVKVTLHRM